MPELPEVEITRRSIEPVLKGQTLRNVWVSDKNLCWPLGCEPHQLEGQQVHELQRRGKYILLRLDHGWLMAHLAEGLSRRTAPIKQLLLVGEVVVGVGNIYAGESLFLAGIHPKRKANSLSIQRVEKLHAAIVKVLSRALEIGGSTLKDFYSPDGEHGYFQLEARVYDQASQPCAICGTAIKRIVQGQRATYYCSTCQR